MSALDVLIISPPGNTAERLYSICEAGGLVAILRNSGMQASVLDGAYYGPDVEPIVLKIKKEKPLLTCIIFQWEHQPFTHWSRQLLTAIAEAKIRTHVTSVGRGATVCQAAILSNFVAIQSIIRGESEKTAIELFLAIHSSQDWTSQKGIAWRRNGTAVVNEPQEPILDLDSLPYADREYLRDNRLYPIAPMYTSRFCYGTCNFCINNIYRDSIACEQYRVRSAANVVAEIEQMGERYGTKTFCFVDNNFFVDGKEGKIRALQIAELLLSKNLNIRFYFECRVNDIDLDLFKLLKTAGLRKVFLGIESGSQSVLDRYNKGTTVEMNEQAIRILRDLKINIEPGFILFDPLTTFSELQESLKFIKKNELFKCKFTYGMNLFNPMNIYPRLKIVKQIPGELWLDNSDLTGQWSYRIKDDRVQLVRELLQLFHKELSAMATEYIWQFQAFMAHFEEYSKFPMYVTQKMRESQEYIFRLQGQFGRWSDGQVLLGIKVFEEIMGNLVKIEQVEDHHKVIQAIMNELIQNNHRTYFGKEYQAQISELRNMWWNV